MMSLHVFWSVFTYFNLIKTFNVDTDYPILYQFLSKSAKFNSYFGISVALRPRAAEFHTDTWLIQIGASRGSTEGTGAIESGAVFRCHLHGPCRLLRLEKALNSSGGKGIYAYTGKADRAWIGGAMDIKKFGSYESSVVCGYRWINQNLNNPENIDITYLMTGICYFQDLFNETSESNIVKLLPLVNSEKIYTPKPYVVNLSTYHWGLGQAGVSALLLEESSGLIIGAPGVTHWIGSVVYYKRNLVESIANFARSEIPKKSRYTYLGYSVAAGKFYKDKKLWFAAGAPRSGNYRGEASYESVFIQSTLKGSTFGEYFGSCLMAVDLNSDGFDDLIVGAPLYSKRYPEEGRIYVYLGTNKGNFLINSQVMSGIVSRARFGSSLTSLKDLNRDGFNDIAVGAPYEDGQRGAVYIYHGSSSGLRTEYSQRIFAREVSPGLRGFGITISSGVDIDGNHFSDLAVGSYLSNSVVLLRSRPIIFLHSEINIGNATLLARKASHVNITFCSRYTGSKSPVYSDVLRVIEIDPLNGRGSFRNFDLPYRRTVRLKFNESFCENLSIVLDLSKKNYSPLQILLRHESPSCLRGKRGPFIINEEKYEGSDDFLKWCPTHSQSQLVREVPFAGICGIDLECVSDVSLSCALPELTNNFHILGSSDNLLLNLKLLNSEEPAYNVKIKIWSNLVLNWSGGKQESWSKSKGKTFEKNIDGLFYDNFQTNFTFNFALEHLFEMKKETNFSLLVEVYSSNTDVNYSNNKCRFSVRLTSDALVKLRSSSSLATYFITKKLVTNKLTFVHYYEVEKTGVSPISEAELLIFIPTYFGRELVSYNIETSDWIHVSLSYEKSPGSPVADIEFHLPTNRNLTVTNPKTILTCSHSEKPCHVLKTVFISGIPDEPLSYAKIILTINITGFKSIKEEKDTVYFATSGILRYKTSFGVTANEIYSNTFIRFLHEKKEETIDGYIIALSVLSGGFVLVIIISWLAKRNFFKRTKKEELHTLKEVEACVLYFSAGSVKP